jgi:hypothetical protein
VDHQLGELEIFVRASAGPGERTKTNKKMIRERQAFDWIFISVSFHRTSLLFWAKSEFRLSGGQK